MEMIDRLLISHRHASYAVQRTVASSNAYSTRGPSLPTRVRLYFSVLRNRLARH
ncbi:MAG: hypothetical protein WBP72_15360 [Rhodocyclaceae bacterium]|jgi:hypothetical protein